MNKREMCGTLRSSPIKERFIMPAPIDLTGHRYGRLTVLGKADQKLFPRKWVCQCDCGNIKNIYGPSMRRGLTTSCGCYHIERHTTHGSSYSRLYNIWQCMKARCYSKDSEVTKYHGSIGVTVCDTWRESFDSFKQWAVSNGYSEELSIDRIKNALIYSPQTCRWATASIQSRNQRVRKGGTSQYIGVFFQKTINKFRTRIRQDGRQIHIGVFVSELDAALARDQYIKEHNLIGYTLNFQ